MQSQNYLSKARKLANKTQKQVADRLKMNQSTYSTKEARLDFTSSEWKEIERVIGLDNIERAQENIAMVRDPAAVYGMAGNDYRQLLSAINEMMILHKTSLAVVAQLIAETKGQPVAKVLKVIREMYKEKSGKDIDI